MELYWYVIMFVFGAIVGSFLNVIIYRLHTGRSLSGRSHCLSCGTTLRWYELFPLFSYAVQSARCRHCGANIPSRYFFVELLTAASFLLLWHLFHESIVFFVIHSALVVVLIIIAVYDVRHTIIPDELSILVGVVALLFLGYSFVEIRDLVNMGTALLSGLGAGLFIGLLWFISKGRWMGLGDAKLALPLGVIVGFPAVLSMIVLSFWVGAIVSIALLFLQKLFKRGKTDLPYLSEPITIRSEVPFAPFLIAGFLLVQLFHANIFDITLWLLPL